MTSQFGLRVGIKNYKMRWIEWGTDDRSYKTGVKKSIWKKTPNKSTGHFTGKLQPTNFFFDAVNAKKAEAQEKVSQSIVDSLNKTVQRYANN
jgi:hypothetical protein